MWIYQQVRPGSAQTASAQKLSIARSRKPFCTRKVSVESSASAIGFRFRIDMQDNSRHLAPVGAHLLRIKHPTVSDGVLFILHGHLVAIGREIGDVWI
jgi:hypothetical protein